MSVDRLQVAVLGGTGVGTPVLISALATAQRQGRLPRIDLRLHGRAVERGRRIVEYAAEAVEGAGEEPGAPVRLRFEAGLAEALDGAHAVICQVRPGGQAGRAADESMALAEGIPGDEGLGPSGLANFLRSRPAMDGLARAWAEFAQGAVFLQLTSPLSLTTARGTAIAGLPMLGVCELPATTSAAVLAAAEPSLGPLSHAHFGLNHRAWLYDFRDASGAERTSEVVRLAAGAGALACDREAALEAGAVPVSYLRLFLHPKRVAAEQRARGQARGAELDAWSRELNAAYLAPGGPDAAGVAALLGRRRMDWHEAGVVPALAVALGFEGAPAAWAFNLVPGGPGAAAAGATAIETPCACRSGRVVALPQPPLPPGPAALHDRLVAYEHAALALPASPRAEDIAAVLALHPLVEGEAQAARLGSAVRARLGEGTSPEEFVTATQE